MTFSARKKPSNFQTWQIWRAMIVASECIQCANGLERKMHEQKNVGKWSRVLVWTNRFRNNGLRAKSVSRCVEHIISRMHKLVKRDCYMFRTRRESAVFFRNHCSCDGNQRLTNLTSTILLTPRRDLQTALWLDQVFSSFKAVHLTYTKPLGSGAGRGQVVFGCSHTNVVKHKFEEATTDTSLSSEDATSYWLVELPEIELDGRQCATVRTCLVTSRSHIHKLQSSYGVSERFLDAMKGMHPNSHPFRIRTNWNRIKL